jgi:hypothetical protein
MGTREAVPSETVAVVAERRCGRCQRPFPGDPTLAFQTGWAICDDCRGVLLPVTGPD